jgi:Domain of unknown function (DUF397)
MDASTAGRTHEAHSDASQRGGEGIEADRGDLVRALWRKSSHSYGNGDCVEVAPLSGGIAVRDSKDKAGPILLFASSEWRSFVGAVKNGEFNF